MLVKMATHVKKVKYDSLLSRHRCRTDAEVVERLAVRGHPDGVGEVLRESRLCRELESQWNDWRHILPLAIATEHDLGEDFPGEDCRVQDSNISREGRFGAHSGTTGRNRSELDAERTVRPRNKAHSYPPRSKASITYCLNVFPEARTREILCKPNAGAKSSVDNRFVSG